MSLSAALHIGRTGLAASQIGVDIAGNNLANASTQGYHRQSAQLAPIGSQDFGQGTFVGKGVQIDQIARHIDQALEGRLRGSIADQSGSLQGRDLLAQIEALQNEFTDSDLSSLLSEFFNAWSELANKPDDLPVRTAVVQQGATLASFITDLRSDLVQLRNDTEGSIGAFATAADDLLNQIEQVTARIVLSENGQGQAHDLHDQRDALLTELSQYIDISTNEHETGEIDIFVGSLPILLQGKSRGLEVRHELVDGQPALQLVIRDDASLLAPTSGRIGALIQGNGKDVGGAVNALDEFAGHLIEQVNLVHSQGQGLKGFNTVLAGVAVDDVAFALNDPNAGLDFTPTHGSFQVHLTNPATGARTTSLIEIDLDGIGGPDTTLTDLAAALGTVANLSTSITTSRRLQIDADPGLEVSFSDDTSGVLSALGINTFFSGASAVDIDVNQVVAADPAILAAAQGHLAGDNRTALAIAALRDEPIDALGGRSIAGFWNQHVEDYALRLSRANQEVEADTLVRENLDAQQQSVSGVNADEEAINLLVFQRAYQGSARFISVVDELMQTLISLV